MKKLLILLLATPLLSIAQPYTTFQKIYGGDSLAPGASWPLNDHGEAVTKLLDGNLLVGGLHGWTGTGYSFIGKVAKIKMDGDTIWTRTFSRQANGEESTIYDLCESTDSSLLCLGTLHHFHPDSANILLSKLDKNGNILWNKVYGRKNHFSKPSQIIEMTNGDYAFAYSGNLMWPSPVNSVATIVRTNTNGDTLWTANLGDSTKGVSIGHMLESQNGGLYVSGFINGIGGPPSGPALFRFDGNGNLLWTKTYGVPGLIRSFVNFVLLPGDSMLMLGSSTGGHDLIKLDPLGNVMWERSAGTSTGNAPVELIALSDGNFASVGNDQQGQHAMTLIKYKPNGDTLWSKQYRTKYNQVKTVIETSDAGFFLVGITFDPTSGDWVFVKTNSKGTSGCNEYGVQLQYYNITGNYVMGTWTPQIYRGLDTATVQVSTQGKTLIHTNCQNLTSTEEYHQSNMKLFPNPAIDQFYIETDWDVNVIQLNITDLNGRLVSTQEITKKGLITVARPDVSQGLYLVNLIMEDGSAVSRKLLLR